MTEESKPDEHCEHNQLCINSLQAGYCDHCIHNPNDPRTKDNYMWSRSK